MKSILQSMQARVVLATSITALFLLSFLCQVHASVIEWNGQGQNGRWQTASNWVAGPPIPGQALNFDGVLQTANTNDFAGGTTFAGITFGPLPGELNAAGAFTLQPLSSANTLNITGDFTNSQVSVAETINIPMTFNATRNFSVVPNGLILITAPISGATAGLNLYGGGTLELRAANTFSNSVNIQNGTVWITGDSSLGIAPSNAVPGYLELGAFGALQATNTQTLGQTRGIALDQTVQGTNSATFYVDPHPVVLTYNGSMTDKTTGGGLTKIGFGQLSLGGSNSYTGPTIVKVGTLTLNYASSNAPANNMISSLSTLTLGGGNSGLGSTNFAELLMIPGTNGTYTQSFASTHLVRGASIIQVNSNTGTAILNLGNLSHDPGSTVVLIPPWAQSGQGTMTTTTPNTQGILGGWATLGNGSLLLGTATGTNFACVDGSGNITNFYNYVYYPAAGGTTLNALVGGPAGTNVNLMIDSRSSGDVVMDVDHGPGLGTITAINTINARRGEAGSTAAWAVHIGSNNVLRLGTYGAIFKSDTQSGVTWLFGEGAGGANFIGGQNIGTITAGTVTNVPGEFIVDANNTSSSSGTIIFDSQVVDNGPNGPVTFVKTGGGSMKLRGHNTYTGGCYLLVGRVQFVGAENSVGTPNPDACGAGNIYCLPGSYLFPSGTGPGGIGASAAPYFNAGVTNPVFIGGSGTYTEPLGAIRMSGNWPFSGPWTLIGDTTLGGSAGTGTGAGPISGKISGPFNMTICSGITVGGNVSLANPFNDWSGNTIIQGRNGNTGNYLQSLTNQILPHGFGKGNVTLNAGTGGNTTIEWDLNGFNCIVNGLTAISSTSQHANGGGAHIINNSAANTSYLTVGDNDQSSTFRGYIVDGNGPMALTKAGLGIFTLGETNNYSGPTIVTNGTLALANVGQMIIRSANITVSNATLDVSQTTGAPGVKNGQFQSAPSGTLTLSTGGALIGNTASAGVGSLIVSNGTSGGITEVLNPNVTNLFANGFITTGGTTNLITIRGVQGVTGYPSTFTILHPNSPAGVPIGGSGMNFGIGQVPTPLTGGYMNYTLGGDVQIILTNGPKNQVWLGTNLLAPGAWDANTTNWLGFGTTPDTYFDQDTVTFNDSGVSNIVNVATNVIPAEIIVNNSVSDYTITGTNSIGGIGDLIKSGTAQLIITNGSPYSPLPNPNSFRGGVTINGGNVVFAYDGSIAGGLTISNGCIAFAGVGGGYGNLPSGAIINNGNIIINRSDTNLVIGGPISGSGNITNRGTANSYVAIGGGNTYTGMVDIASGTLAAQSSTALGSQTKTNVNRVEFGATFDDNGQGMGRSPIVVAANNVGVGGNGALVNNSATVQDTAFANVTLEGNVVFGGYTRWDIRGSTATLNTSPPNQPYQILKLGTNQISFSGPIIDYGLGDIIVSQGLFSAETTISGSGGNTAYALGDPSHSVIVSNTAEFQMYAVSNPGGITKQLQLWGNSPNVSWNIASGAYPDNIWNGLVSLNSNCVINIGAGESLDIAGQVSDGGVTPSQYGGITLTGGGTLYLENGTINYSLPTVVSNGSSLYVDGGQGGGPLGNVTVYPGGTIGGNGIIGGGIVPANLSVISGTVTPGDAVVGSALGTLTVNGSVVMTNTVNSFTLGVPNGHVGNWLSSDGVDASFSGATLTLQGTNVFNISVNRYTVRTNIYLLMRSSNPINITSNKIVINATQPGYGFHLMNPTNVYSISGFPYYGVAIYVDTAIGNDTWKGYAGNRTWDEQSVNWLSANGLQVNFTNFDFVNFDDNAIPEAGNATTNYFITIAPPLSGNVGTNGVQPQTMLFMNTADTYCYVFQGSGFIGGTNGLYLNSGQQGNSGAVILDNSGTNTFSGNSIIEGGLLQVGNNDGNGSIGMGGTITLKVDPSTNTYFGWNNLVYARTNDYIQSNNIAGGGIVTKLGGGNLTLGGVGNSFTGQVLVVAGTLTLNDVAPLGQNANAFISVSNGAALGVAGGDDGSGQQVKLPNTVIVGGGGPGYGTNGAIVNNSSSSEFSAFQHGFILTTNTVFGGSTGNTNTMLPLGSGPGRWDIRAPSATDTNCVLNCGLLDAFNPGQLSLTSGAFPYSITKVGSNQVGLVDVIVDPVLGNIDIEQGSMTIQGITTLGDPSHTLTVNYGAAMQLYATTVPLQKSFILNGNGPYNDTIDIGSGSANTLCGPIQLNGTVQIDTGGGSLTFLTNLVSGTGGLRLTNGNSLIMDCTNTYTGNTEINNGSLILEDSATLNSSPVILISGTGGKVVLSDNALLNYTLTLALGQQLQGVGNVVGGLDVAAGTTLQPGINLGTTNTPIAGTMTVSNQANLEGSIIMGIDNVYHVYSALVDKQSIAINNVSASLVVTNLTPLAPFIQDQAFTLLSAPNISGGWASVTLPALGSGLQWVTNQTATNYTATVIKTATNNPTITSIANIGGTNLVITGTGGGGSGIAFYVLTATNMAPIIGTPLNQTNHVWTGYFASNNWTRLATNFFGAGGTFNVSIPVTPSQSRFVAIQVP